VLASGVLVLGRTENDRGHFDQDAKKHGASPETSMPFLRQRPDSRWLPESPERIDDFVGAS
jgi:hypothetical protein